jgi:kumamolisin
MKSQTKTMALLAGCLLTLSAFAGPPDSSGSPLSESPKSPPTPQAGHVYVPESSKPQPAGFAHTDYVLFSLDGGRPTGERTLSAHAVAGPDDTIETLEVPCSLGYLYVNSPAKPCTPGDLSSTGGPSAAGQGAIALVDAFDNPDAASDLATFDTQFGLAAASFTKLYANKGFNSGASCSGVPPTNSDWEVEESLDIEWAHVFAPKAKIILVEACSNSTSDLLIAEQYAFQYITAHYAYGGQVSNSWGAGESSGQISSDNLFADFHYTGAKGYRIPILAFASTGDSAGAIQWPATNPWVMSAGGTSVLRNSDGSFNSESCWGDSGGGVSAVETYETTFTGGNMGPWANYQYGIFGQANRAVPDISFDADPASGAAVYNQAVYGGWVQVGGTSLSSPALASIVNRALSLLSSSTPDKAVSGTSAFATREHNLIYAALESAERYKANFYDVTTGSNGNSALVGYDECTGVGSPRGLGYK